MELRFTPKEDAWRAEVRAFLDRELPPEKAFDTEFVEDEELWEFALAFTRKLGARGWIGLTWPREYGGLGRSIVERFILAEELSYREAPIVNQIGWSLAAGTLLLFGSEEQKRRFLPPIARSETFWVEGLSEPGAGSDLANLSCTAVRDGSDWIVNGQKTYTTWGSRADVMYLAARTEPGSTRHRGISIFCVDMKAPGVTLSPLYNLGGGRQNHTYFDDVRVPGDRLIGEAGHGWRYVMNAFYGGGSGNAAHMTFRRMLEEVVAHCKTQRRGGRLLIHDPLVRQQLAELAELVETARVLMYEGLSNAMQRRAPAFGGALGVVVLKELRPRFAQLCNRILGPLCQLKAGRFAPLEGHAEAWYRQSYANHAGGTPQVKRMVLATRGLGLPR
jgi:alkylation response protein AidB-like acyl-CoA dehydrogenase